MAGDEAEEEDGSPLLGMGEVVGKGKERFLALVLGVEVFDIVAGGRKEGFEAEVDDWVCC